MTFDKKNITLPSLTQRPDVKSREGNIEILDLKDTYPKGSYATFSKDYVSETNKRAGNSTEISKTNICCHIDLLTLHADMLVFLVSTVIISKLVSLFSLTVTLSLSLSPSSSL